MKHSLFRLFILLSISSLLFSCGEETFKLIDSEDVKTESLDEIKAKSDKNTEINQIKISTSSKAVIKEVTYSGKKEEYYKVWDKTYSFYSKISVDADNYLIKSINYSSDDKSYYMAYDGKAKYISTSGNVAEIVDKTASGKILFSSDKIDKLVSEDATKADIKEYILSLTPIDCFLQTDYDLYKGNQGSYKMTFKENSFVSDIFFSDLGKITEEDLSMSNESSYVNIRKIYEYSCSFPPISLTSYKTVLDTSDMLLIENTLLEENPFLSY